MAVPIISGLSLGLRLRTKFLLTIFLSLAALYYVIRGSRTHPIRNPKPTPDADPEEGRVPPLTLASVAVSHKDPSLSTPGVSHGKPDADVDPELEALASSFLNGRMPKGMTGPARSRVYEWARKAEEADLEARRAYDAAIDAKAMLFVSAATDLRDLIGRYWQTYKKHYNPSVQSVAATRIREFLRDGGSSSSDAEKRHGKIPLCLVATYDGRGGEFPDYATVLMDSVARNAPYADLRVFVHNTTASSYPSHMHRANAKVIDVAQIDPSYGRRGFAGLATDRLCALMGRGRPQDPSFGWEDQDAECALLEARLRAFEGTGGRAIEQLRGHWGNLFGDWISPDRCDAWGWLDLGTAVGDLAQWMDNTLINDADLFTTHEGDDWRLYLRNSFTVHNYRRGSERTSDLWERCEDLASLPGLLKAFERPDAYMTVTEGCYSHGALTQPGISAVLAPWQLPSWSNPQLLILDHGRVNYCIGEGNAEVCRGWVRGFMQEQVSAAKKLQLRQAEEEDDEEEGYRPSSSRPRDAYRTAKDVFSHDPLVREPTQVLAGGTECADWLPTEYNLCAEEHGTDPSDATHVQLLHVPESSSSSSTTTVVRLQYVRPSDGVGSETVSGRGVGQTLVVKFLDWATRPRESRPGTPRRLKVETTWFYTFEKGSMQISPGRILLHTTEGVW
ncbi:hypothetical protein HKX48_003417 [Thoreauomyces humboldtii]|nr:hypothetical protein HKX48_003417 [Thoreauomyces humboldtii]